MVVAQKLQEAEITEQASLDLTMNLLRSAIFSISYNRGLFPDDYFIDEPVPALDMMKIKKLLPKDAKSYRMIGEIDYGVYDALQKKYLKTLTFGICETDGPMIEEYVFSFSYPDSHSQDVMMEINLTGNKKHGGTFNSTADITPEQMRKSARKMVRDLLQWMFTLDNLPDKFTIMMKLRCYVNVTPPDYQPPFFFSGCTEEQAQYVWTKNPVIMKAGIVNSKHHVLTLTGKAVDEDSSMETLPDPFAIQDRTIVGTGTAPTTITITIVLADDGSGVSIDLPFRSNQTVRDIHEAIDERTPDSDRDYYLQSMIGVEYRDMNTTVYKISTGGSTILLQVFPDPDGQTAPKDGKPIPPEDYMYMKDVDVNEAINKTNNLQAIVTAENQDDDDGEVDEDDDDGEVDEEIMDPAEQLADAIAVVKARMAAAAAKKKQRMQAGKTPVRKDVAAQAKNRKLRKKREAGRENALHHEGTKKTQKTPT